MLNQYVWLAGMPVAVVKTTLNASYQRVATPTQCKRNDEAEPCGTYFIVNDALPKPVALIDSAGRLAGSGEYDVFGRVNEVTVSQDTPAAPGTPPQPFGAYLPSQNTVLAYLKQPAGSAALRVQLRVKYGSINTGSFGDATWVKDGNTGAQLTPWYQGWVLGQKTTPWVQVASNGLVHVRWQSDGVGENATYSGVTVGSYEYRRYEVGASPWWVPLRFPGQYADQESGLFENWNRFYDPSTGKYSAVDPILSVPDNVPFPEIYGYALNNPIMFFDATGLEAVFVRGSDGQAIDTTKDAKMKAAYEEAKRRVLAALQSLADNAKDSRVRAYAQQILSDKSGLKVTFKLESLGATLLGDLGVAKGAEDGKSGTITLGLYRAFPSQADDGATKGGVATTYEDAVSHEVGHLYGQSLGNEEQSNQALWSAPYVGNQYRSLQGHPLEAGHKGPGAMPAGFAPTSPKPPHKKAK